MKKIIISFLLALFIVVACLKADAATIAVQSINLTGWNDTRTNVELWVFSSDDWVDAAGIPHGAGNPDSNKIWTQRITGLSNNTSTHTLSIPGFNLTSTRDAQRGNTVRLTFWIMAPSGSSASKIAAIPSTQNGLQIPDTIASTSGCSPNGTCASFSDLISYNTSAPPLPPDSYYTKDQIDRIVSSQLVGAPAGAAYVTNIPNSTLTNEQALSLLSTGIVKNTTSTGILTIAVAETDYSLPLTVNSPILRSSNAISIQQSNSSQSGYLSSTDWSTFNGKQAALGFTPENSANRNATNGYAGLSSGKITTSQIQEVLGLTDLTDVTGASGVGSTVPKGTFTSLTLNDVMTWNGTNWINQAPASGSVSSVGLATNASWFTITNSPVTGAGTLTFNLTTGLTANQFTGTPDGTTGVVGLRSIVNGDLPVITVPHGGSGGNSFTTYAILAGGTSSTGNFQQVSGVGTSGQVLTSNGASQLPTWQTSVTTHTLLAGSPTVPDTAAGTVIRGDIITGQNSGTPLWTKLTLGAANRYLSSDGTDVVYAQVSLSAGVTGTLPFGGGGTGQTSYTDGQLLIGNSATGGLSKATLTAGSGNISITNGNGTIIIDTVGTPGSAWDTLSAPTGDATLAMAAHKTTWTWGSATGSSDMFTYKDATTNSSATGHLVVIQSVGSSTIKPILITVGGTTIGVEMNSAGVLAPIGTGGITANQLSGASTTAGFQVQTGTPGIFVARSIAAGVGIAVTNGSGASSNPSIATDLSTLVASQTIFDGSQSSRTITFNLSGTDPVLTLSSSVFNVSTGTIQQGGTAVALSSVTVTGTNGVSGGGSLATNQTLSIDQTFSHTWTGVDTFSPTLRTSGIAPYLKVTTPADTGQTLDTEFPGIVFGGNSSNATVTRTGADGTTYATQREYLFVHPTYAFAGTTTVTDSATVAISGPPTIGSNATLTNRYALWLQGGTGTAGGSAIRIDGLTGANQAVFDIRAGTTNKWTVYRDDTHNDLTLQSSNGSTNVFTIINTPVSGFGRQTGRSYFVPYDGIVIHNNYADETQAFDVASAMYFYEGRSGGDPYSAAGTGRWAIGSHSTSSAGYNKVVIDETENNYDRIFATSANVTPSWWDTSSGFAVPVIKLLAGSSGSELGSRAPGNRGVVFYEPITNNDPTNLNVMIPTIADPSTSYFGLNIGAQIKATAADNAQVTIGVSGFAQNTTNTTKNLTGSLIGVYGFAKHQALTASTVTLVASVYGDNPSISSPSSGTNTVTNFANIYAAGIGTTGANRVATNAYGLYVGAVTGGGTLNRAIYTAGGAWEQQGSNPVFSMTDTTASAKSLTIDVDSNRADFRESAGAAASLLQLDLANNRVGIGGAPGVTLDVALPSAVGSKVKIQSAGAPRLDLYSTNANSGARNWSFLTDVTAFGDFNIRQSNAKDGDPGASGTTYLYISNVGNIKIGGTATRGTTEGTNELVIFNGTAPAGTLTNGASFFAASGEMRVMDSAGNNTLLSPHDLLTNEWIFYSCNSVSNKCIKVNMEKLVRVVEKLSGEKLKQEWIQ